MSPRKRQLFGGFQNPEFAFQHLRTYCQANVEQALRDLERGTDLDRAVAIALLKCVVDECKR
jgi:hypothetical protein